MEPGVIKKLDEAVVNRIAAGEIIQRPANALKEMIENSLDAKSSYIQITVKNGGLKQLQIQDNGTGIRKEDLEIVCERFTTSKLEKFEDLSSIATFGFRGEALASISHVAHLTIQTKTALEKCGFKASYEDGKLKGPPKPCAGNQGTIITVEDLFYNVPQRKQALKSPNEEFQKISDVVNKYAIHNSGVGFMVKKYGENVSMRTPPKSTKVENIKIIYGAQIAKELLEVGLVDEVHKFKMSGWITTVNYSARKGNFLLFINHRLVDSAAMKSAIESAYSTYLPKGSYPFVYINLELEPSNVDVNVHPTKHEVHFLHEDEIIEKIKLNLETKLIGSNSARTFYKQTRLPGASETVDKTKKDSERVYDKNFVRTDAKEQKLDKFLLSSPTKKKIKGEPGCSPGNITVMKEESFLTEKRKETKLASVLNMRRKIESACSSLLKRAFKESVFVGVVDKDFALIQCQTKLYLCNTRNLSQKLFYQRLIYNFENFKEIKFNPPLPLKELVMVALDDPENGWTEEDGPKDELAMEAAKILIDKSPIMREYFGLRISEDGFLESLPILLHNHKPSMTFLPMYILRLATEIDWESEEECFRTFCEETAKFYCQVPYSEDGSKTHRWMVEHIIYPGLKQYLIPGNELKASLFELANLPNLYKVFERC